MIIGTVIQQPTENLDYDIDYASLVTTPEDTLSTVVASVTPAGLTVSGLVANTTTGKLWATGGVNGVEYTVTIVTTTVQGRIKEDEIIVLVEEIA
jgi:hypothetical protein|tara:strand:+ start:873 stop:1157 length:285 start_codon:yes stop_codon:yes gene_type:complete